VAALGAPPAWARTESYQVDYVGPRALKDAVEAELDVYRWREAKPAPDSEMLERLAREAEAQAADLLAARGYLNPRVEARLDLAKEPPVITLELATGEPTRVASVSIEIRGPILASTDPLDRAAQEAVRTGWKLPPGRRFTQARWDVAKALAVSRLSERRWLAARVAESEARLDPATATAVLTVVLESGAPYRFGELQIQGLARYRKRRVAALRTYEVGDPYAREPLDRFQRRLAETGYFASAHVGVDPEPTSADAAPVRVSVIEAAARRVEIGLGYGTDTQGNGSIEYRDHDFGARALRLRLRGEADFLEQGVEGEITLPERPRWSDSLGGRLEHTDIEDLDTKEISVVAKTTALDERSRPQWSGTFAYSQQHAKGALSESAYALLCEYTHTWRDTDDLINPRAGWMSQIQVGGAPPGVSTRGFGRAIGRAAYYWRAGVKDDLAFRSEAGAVFASDTAGIPQSMLFRTGGSTSVRGYDLESLGVDDSGAVLGGRYLLVLSAEYTHWFRSRFGGALFVDAGNARDDLDRFPLALGYGVGLRAASAIGPIRVDLAWGQEDQTLRLHFSLGLTF
jgi:translocation and assembly module TamA